MMSQIDYWAHQLHYWIHQQYELLTLIAYFIAAFGTIYAARTSLHIASYERREQDKRKRTKYDLLVSLQGKRIKFGTDTLEGVGVLKKVEESWLLIDRDQHGDQYYHVNRLVWIHEDT